MTSKKIKVIFVTMNEPFYIPKYMDKILNKLGNEVEVIKVYASPSTIQNKSFLRTVHGFFSYFGLIVFSYMILLRLIYLTSDFICRLFKTNGQPHSVELVCKKYGISYSQAKSINAINVLNDIKQLNPDIVFSIACPQIFGKALISIPSKGCLNIHSSLLPEYRGLNANFWVLTKGEKTTGVTIHYVNPGIDDGDILLQEKIKINDTWSLNDLYLRVIAKGSSMVAKCLKLIYEDNVTTQKNDLSKGSYFTFPARKDVIEFRRNNKKFFKYY
jgi:methionyl-tRNA formyltransferase